MRLGGLSSVLTLVLMMLGPPRPAAGLSPPLEGLLGGLRDRDDWEEIIDSICDQFTTTEAPTTTTTPPTTTTEAPTTTTEAPTTRIPHKDAAITAILDMSIEDFCNTRTTRTTQPGGTTPNPLTGLDLYQKTRNELSIISETLDSFARLVEADAKAARRVRGGRGHPGAWWQSREATRPRESSYKFCKEITDPSTSSDSVLCYVLEKQLEGMDNLLSDLESHVNDWDNAQLTELQKHNGRLEDIYTAADKSTTFKDSLDQEKFNEAIADVKHTVDDCYDAVGAKIEELDPDPSSVILVAVMGTVGGLMVLAIVGVMVYGAFKKSKTNNIISTDKISKKSKKKNQPYPNDEIRGESVPINAFLQDSSAPRPAPRTNVYSNAPVPAPRYGPQYDARREPVFPEVMAGRRPPQGLRRTDY